MNQGKKGRSRQSTGKKKPYRSPELTVHGDVRTLTLAKKGKNADGTGRPRTRISFFNP
jgi:hypothetical protein